MCLSLPYIPLSSLDPTCHLSPAWFACTQLSGGGAQSGWELLAGEGRGLASHVLPWGAHVGKDGVSRDQGEAGRLASEDVLGQGWAGGCGSLVKKPEGSCVQGTLTSMLGPAKCIHSTSCGARAQPQPQPEPSQPALEPLSPLPVCSSGWGILL